MAQTFLRVASEEDVASVFDRLRLEDLREAEAATGLYGPQLKDVFRRLTQGTRAEHSQAESPVFCGGIEGGPPELLFGCDPVPYFPRVGQVWLVGTDTIKEHPREFHIRAVQTLAILTQQYDLLTNFADARNDVHIGWIKRLGFTFLRRVERFGAESRPFLEFAKPCA
jgi:hypothetical protein